MYRPGINGVFSLIFILPLFLFASCSNAQVLGISRTEASRFLKKGDIGFIRSSELPDDFPQAVSRLGQLLLIHPGAPYYAGLLAEPELKTTLFSAALESSSPPARQEAILKLVHLVLENKDNARRVLAYLDSAKPKPQTETLRAACLYKLEQCSEAGKLLSGNPEAEWEKALALFAEWKNPDCKTESTGMKPADLILNPPPEKMPGWVYREALSINGLLSPAEKAALSIRQNPGDYNVMLNNLPEILQDGGSVFFRYPELIADLGRAFQYTPARREEGLQFLYSLNRLLDDGDDSGENADKLKAAKFRISFYSGRIERARGNYEESSKHFNRSLTLAPDELQSDSCIWYMLMNSLAKDPLSAVSLAIDTMNQWNDPSYFDDFLDRLSCYLTGRRQWYLLLELFQALEKQDAACASLAQYAWILGRAVEEAYITTDRDAESFFNIAFGKGTGAFYYRAMAALKLGTSFLPENQPENRKEKRTAEKAKTEKDEIDFILGFFECGAAAFALPCIQAREEKLSAADLEKAAEALAASERWKESLDLVSRCINKKGYAPGRGDLLLFYPRPHKELIEKYAKETGLGPEILYGLIRTESYFMSGVVSRSGATGLAQLMAPTAMEMAGRIARRGGPDYRGPNGIDLTDPEVNIHLGSYYLSYLSEQLGNPMLALLAYNGGMGRIRRAFAADKRQNGGLPRDLFLETIEIHETREYGRRVLAAAAVYGYLYYGMSMEDVASDIFRADLFR